MRRSGSHTTPRKNGSYATEQSLGQGQPPNQTLSFELNFVVSFAVELSISSSTDGRTVDLFRESAGHLAQVLPDTLLGIQ